MAPIDKILTLREDIRHLPTLGRDDEFTDRAIKKYVKDAGFSFVGIGGKRFVIKEPKSKRCFKVLINSGLEDNLRERLCYEMVSRSVYAQYFPKVFEAYEKDLIIEVEYFPGNSLDYVYDKLGQIDLYDNIWSQVESICRSIKNKFDRNLNDAIDENIKVNRKMDFKLIDCW